MAKKTPSKARQKKRKTPARPSKVAVRKKSPARRAAARAKTRPAQAARPKTQVAATPRRPAATKDGGRRAAGAGAAFLAEATADAKLQAAAPAEPPLTPEEIEEFRQMLLQKRAQILGDVSTLQSEALSKNRRDASGDLSSMPIHMADLGTDNYEQEFTLGLIESERAVLQEIEEALARIRDGTYGLCAATGKPIGKARLRAKPWAKYCYEYALAQEKGQTRGL